MSQDPNVVAIYNQFKSWIDGTNSLSASSIIILIPKIMKCAEEEIKLSGKGDYKKSVVLQVIKQIVQDSKLDTDGKVSLNIIIDTIVPTMIDTMVLVSRGKVDIGKAVKTSCMGCF
jgi:hypothetical protein